MSGKIYAPLKSKALSGDPSDPTNNYADISGTDFGDKRLLDVNILQSVSPGTTNTVTTIVHEDIIAANTEQSYALPANCTRFILRSQNTKELKIAYVSGGTSSDKYLTIKRGNTYEDDSFYLAQTIYFQSPDADDIIEIATFV